MFAKPNVRGGSGSVDKICRQFAEMMSTGISEIGPQLFFFSPFSSISFIFSLHPSTRLKISSGSFTSLQASFLPDAACI